MCDLLTSARAGARRPLLVIGWLFFAIDPEENRLLRVVTLHLHHNVVFAGLPFSEVLLARSATNPALLVEEIQHTAQNSQKQDADDDDCDNKTFALFLDIR